MTAWTLAWVSFGLALNAPRVETAFGQVHPAPKLAGKWVRSPGQTRAVVLIHGLWAYVANEADVRKAEFHGWQKAGSVMVKTLAPKADVYSFAYGQNAPVEDIAQSPVLLQQVTRLKAMGYQEIIFVGHSAGGLIARLFVEDH